MRLLACLCLLAVVGCGGLSSEPATCKDLAELLAARGVPVEWRGRAGGQSIWLLDKAVYDKECDTDINVLCEYAGTGSFMPGAPLVSVTQLATESAAKENAGATTNAFAYGRFVIRCHSSGESHGKFFEKVKKAL